MTEGEVRDVIVDFLQTALEGDYPEIKVTPSAEVAINWLKQKKPTCLVEFDKGDFIPTPGSCESEWHFLIDLSAGVMPFAEVQSDASTQADRALSGALREAINGNTGYATLRDAGLLMAECKTWPEEQKRDGTNNPHLFTCSTFV